MQNILALLNRIETARSVLAAAGLVARRVGVPRIGVLHVRPGVDPTFMPTEEVMTGERERRFKAATAAWSADLRGIFAAWQAEAGANPAADWREVVGETRAVVAAESRGVDLVVVGRAPPHHPEDADEAITAALFDAGVAILVVPEAAPQTVGEHAAIAWKSDPRSEKAVASARSLLLGADRITVLIGKEGEDTDTATAALLHIIAEKSDAVVVREFLLGQRDVGDALLAEARAAGADLLVMGAYSHSRAYEWILGGATREVLTHTDLPVFMRH
jgi:nucleotide-binding universal stress UspA family protein